MAADDEPCEFCRRNSKNPGGHSVKCPNYGMAPEPAPTDSDLVGRPSPTTDNQQWPKRS